jgi:hypothetical protein
LQDSRDMAFESKTTKTGEPGQVSLTGQPGKVSMGRRKRTSQDMTATPRTAAKGEPWTRLLRQDNWHRTAGTGQQGTR